MVVSETMLFHVLPLQNHKSLQNPLQNGLLLLLTWHSSKGLAPDCAGSIFASIHTFFCSSIMRPQSERSSSHVPHHSKSCPYKMRGFLLSTYNANQRVRVVVLFFFPFSRTYNLRLWTAQNFWVFDTHHVVPSKTQRHTHRTTWSLADLFPRCFESWEGKDAANPSVVLFSSIWILGAFEVYYKMGILQLITQNDFECL